MAAKTAFSTSRLAVPAPAAARPAAGSPSGSGQRRQVASLRSPVPRPGVVTAATAVVALGFGAAVATAFTTTDLHQVTAPGGVAMLLGNVTGLAGTYLALVMVLLVSRVPFVERALGQDGLLRWHRRTAPWPISLIVAHALLLTVGYAQAARTGTLYELGTIVGSFPDMVTATVGFAIMVAVAIASVRAVRRRLRRETWWAFHLFMYLALALAFAHEIVIGQSFVGHPLTQVMWSAAWAATAGLVLTYRVGLPVYRSLYHRLTVAEIRPEGPDAISVILKGRHLDRLGVSGGQFFEWRFLVRSMWWQAHPFSISARPQPPYMRLTVRSVGDFTSALARLPLGARVAVEGPYGAFTAYALKHRKVALIAGGIGVTSVRSLLEDLPRGCRPVVVLRASDEGQLYLRDEVAELVRRHGGELHELVGPRSAVPLGEVVRAVGDLRHRDMFVAGSEGFVTSLVALLEHLGVPGSAVHAEVYSI